MSRHGKFYSDLKHGGTYDDEYDDEDEYDYDYDDEGDYGYDEEPAAPAANKKGGSAVTTAKTGAAPATTVKQNKVDALGIALNEPDYELLVGPCRSIRTMLGDVARLPAIVDALRNNNYSADEAVVVLLAAAEEEKVAAAAAKKVEPIVIKPKTSSGAKVLKLGGGGSGPTTAAANNNNNNNNNNVLPSTPSASQASNPSCGNAAASPTTAAEPAMPYSPMRRAPSGSMPTAPGTQVQDSDGKQACTIVIAGHVDSGKSTILGHLLLLLGKFTNRDVDRNEKEGQKGGKASFKFAWLLDQSEEERRRGVTIDAGSQTFETAKRRVNILDAPGHKDYVMNMISSATQADVALLVVTAGVGEFESGLQHGTKEHAKVLRALGVHRLIVAINKMDAVNFSQERFDFVVQELMLMLKQANFSESDIIGICPVSGLAGINLTNTERNAQLMPWYTGGCSIVDLIDAAPIENRLVDAALRLSVQDIQKSTLYAKVESGKVEKGDTIVFVPAGIKIQIKSIEKLSAGSENTGNSVAAPSAVAGEMVELTTSSETLGIYSGCIGCHPKSALVPSQLFEVHIQTFPSMESSILPGASFMMAVHSLVVPVTVKTLISKRDKQGKWSAGMVKCIPPGTQALLLIQAEVNLALEPAEVCRALGRFVLRQSGETVAGGMVTRVR